MQDALVALRFPIDQELAVPADERQMAVVAALLRNRPVELA
jgi:hypothetical protein